MIVANRDMILLNKRLDKESRRNVYIPTQISGISLYAVRRSSENGGFHSEIESFKIRIPFDALVQDGRIYLPETHYDGRDSDDVSEFWTLHNEDLIIICASDFADVNSPVFEETSVTMEQAKEMAEQEGFQKELIHIVEYADNTLRGSTTVRHWRIGGA